MGSKTLILIDGHALAYRSFFALERTGMKTSAGLPTWAVYGFFKSLFDLLKKVSPDAIAVSFDVGRETFRLEAYPEYKANRQAMPDSLKEQLSVLIEGIEAFGIPIYKMSGYEADDIIGTISKKASELGYKTLILTGDQDSFQLLDEENVTVLIPSKGELIEYDKEKVHDKMGVWPEQIIDYKGLRGDSSDNIPGIKGVGEKTAVKLLTQFGTMENILSHTDEVSGNAIRKKIEEGKEIAEKSKFLATIKRDVPIEFDFEHTHLTMPDVEKLTDYLRKVEFKSFLKQLPDMLTPFNEGVKPAISDELLSMTKQKATVSVHKADNQMGLFDQKQEQPQEEIPQVTLDVNIVDSNKTFDNFIAKLSQKNIFSFDIETTGLDTFNNDLVGMAFAWNDQIQNKDNQIYIDAVQEDKTESFYVPVAHNECNQPDFYYVLDRIKPLLEDENILKVIQNIKFELNFLKKYNINISSHLYDTMLASYVNNPASKHGLKQQASYHLKYEMQPIEDLIGAGKSQITMDKVNIEAAAQYAAADAKSTLELGKFYTERLDESEKKILMDIEIPLVPVLAQMERTGVCLDLDYLKSLSEELEVNIQKIEAEIFGYSGLPFNVNSPKQVGDVLFERLNLSKKPKKTKTGYSTSAKVLESLKDEHPIINLLLEHRHLSKLKSTYIDALPALVNPATGRVHTSFNQTITSTGRLSSSNPNLQNIPIKTELGNRIRAAFIPTNKDSEVILSVDYSQIELRLLAHYSEDPILIDAYKSDKDIHTTTAASVFDVPMEEVTKDMRRKAKAVNFGIIYGQSNYGLAESLGIPPKEAKEIIEKYFVTYPKIKAFMDGTIAEAHEKGYVTTLYGRKRYLQDELSSRNRSIREFAERAAINAPLQGTAADLIKIAMINLHKELISSKLNAKLILQVHDELVLEVPKNELDDTISIVKKCMELDQPLKVPLLADVNCGPSWMET